MLQDVILDTVKAENNKAIVYGNKKSATFSSRAFRLFKAIFY
jgi:hypothetical protein